MDPSNKKKNTWKAIVIREAVDYLRNFFYLACFFGVFTWYRRLILYSYQITYLEYGISLIEAAVLAKFVMVGQALGLGGRLDQKPLIFPILYKTVIFSLTVGVFGAIEHLLRGFFRGEGPSAVFHGLAGGNGYELLAKSLVIFFAFIPFFALKEMGRVLGYDEIKHLFLKSRTSAKLKIFH